ncbi:MAG: hypothetical protein ACI9HK_003476 [Pirellulaceae bacterium]
MVISFVKPPAEDYATEDNPSSLTPIAFSKKHQKA